MCTGVLPDAIANQAMAAALPDAKALADSLNQAVAGMAFYGIVALAERAATSWHPSYRA